MIVHSNAREELSHTTKHHEDAHGQVDYATASVVSYILHKLATSLRQLSRSPRTRCRRSP